MNWNAHFCQKNTVARSKRGFEGLPSAQGAGTSTGSALWAGLRRCASSLPNQLQTAHSDRMKCKADKGDYCRVLPKGHHLTKQLCPHPQVVSTRPGWLMEVYTSIIQGDGTRRHQRLVFPPARLAAPLPLLGDGPHRSVRRRRMGHGSRCLWCAATLGTFSRHRNAGSSALATHSPWSKFPSRLHAADHACVCGFKALWV